MSIWQRRRTGVRQYLRGLGIVAALVLFAAGTQGAEAQTTGAGPLSNGVLGSGKLAPGTNTEPSLTGAAGAYPGQSAPAMQLATFLQDPLISNGAWRPSALTEEDLYMAFSSHAYTFKAGDQIRYEVYLENPTAGVGGIDVQTTTGARLSAQPGVVDQNGISASPTANLQREALRRWYLRIIDVPAALVGETSDQWMLATDILDPLAANGGRGSPNVTETLYTNIEITNSAGVPQPGGLIYTASSDQTEANTVQSEGASGQIATIDANPPIGQPTVENSHMLYPPDGRLVVATVNATQAPYDAQVFARAPAPPGVDDTAAIQGAINDVYAAGGGTVYLPAGVYPVAGTLSVPNGVVLEGDWKSPATWSAQENGDLGTILEVTSQGGSATGQAFITLSADYGLSTGSVSDLTIWYANQVPPNSTQSPIPYPWTIEDSLGAPANVRDVTLVNSYQGILMQNLGIVNNVYGTALKTGLIVQNAGDVTRLTTVNLSYTYWERSGLPGSPNSAQTSALLSWELSNSTEGMAFGNTSLQQTEDISLSGYATGIDIAYVPGSGGVANLEFWGTIDRVNMSDVGVGVNISNLQGNVDGALYNADIQATQAAIKMDASVLYSSGEAFDKPFVVSESVLANVGTSGSAVEVPANGALLLNDDTFASWPRAAGSAAVEASAGSVTVEHSDFAMTDIGASQDVSLSKNVVSADVLDNTFAAAPAIDNVQGEVPGRIIVDLTPPSRPFEQPKIRYQTPDLNRYEPTTDRLFDVLDPQPGCSNCKVAVPNGLTDDTAAIQARLNYAATQGGGTVYLPAGLYLLGGTLQVPPNVLLLGATNAVQLSDIQGTWLLTTHQGATAFITLEGGQGGSPGGGVEGIKIAWPNQGHTADTLIAYPWAITGAGQDVYVENVLIENAYRGIGMGTEAPAEGYLISGVYGIGAYRGISAQGTSSGWIQDVQLDNPAWGESQLYNVPPSVWGDQTSIPSGSGPDGYPLPDNLANFGYKNLVGFSFGASSSEQLLNDFVLASHIGITFAASSSEPSSSPKATGATPTAALATDRPASSGPQVVGVNLGVDGTNDGDVFVGPTTKEDMDFANLIIDGYHLPGGDYLDLNGGSSVWENTIMWNTLNPDKGITVTGSQTSATISGGTMTSGAVALEGGQVNLYDVDVGVAPGYLWLPFQQVNSDAVLPLSITIGPHVQTASVEGIMADPEPDIVNQAGSRAMIRDNISRVVQINETSGPAVHKQEIGAASGGSNATTTLTASTPTTAGDTILVAVDTFVAASATVTDSAGNTYTLLASEPGVYLYGVSDASALPAGGTITISVSGDTYGFSVIADEWSGVTTTVVDGPTGTSEAGTPITNSVTTYGPAPGDLLLLLAAGGGDPATVSISSGTMSVEQQIGGVSAVTAWEQVSPGTYSTTLSWSDQVYERSTMLVGLETG